jgi:hypothetical protein
MTSALRVNLMHFLRLLEVVHLPENTLGNLFIRFLQNWLFSGNTSNVTGWSVTEIMPISIFDEIVTRNVTVKLHNGKAS